MLPLALVTGFLGSGKTTLLRQLVRKYEGRKMLYLVNEFGQVDVDGRRLAEEAEAVLMLPGGSIFCSCLVTEFMDVLEWIPGRFTDVEGVIIEASGISDPNSVGRMLRETQLDGRYTVGTIVSVVDPGTFSTLLQTLPNIRKQVEASDCVLINKADLHDDEALAQTEALVRELRADVPIYRTRHCEIDLDLFAPGGGLELTAQYCQGRDPHYDTRRIVLQAPLDLDALRESLRSASGEVFRLKGYARTLDGPRYIDYSAGKLEAEPAAEEQLGEALAGEVVVIFDGQHNVHAAGFIEAMENGSLSRSQ